MILFSKILDNKKSKFPRRFRILLISLAFKEYSKFLLEYKLDLPNTKESLEIFVLRI